MSTQAYYKDRLGFDPAESIKGGYNHNVNNNSNNHRSSTLPRKGSQQGYEENLSKFKGTSIWGFFIEQTGTIFCV